MTSPAVPTRRGLSLLEMLLALSITALIAVGISSMISAVTSGVGTRRDLRTTMVRANAAQTRLAAYIVPCRTVLASNGSDLVLWLNDSRESDSVHATEIRWLLFDADQGAIDVHFVDFPDAWTQTAKDLADTEYSADADWDAVLTQYQTNGWVTAVRLADGLDSAWVSTDAAVPMDSRHIIFELGFQTDDGPVPVRVPATVRLHQPPMS